MCHHWGCADANGVCKPEKSKWLDPAVRIAPVLSRHSYLTMKVENEGGPHLVDGWPSGPNEDEAMWSFLIQHDGETVQITTKKSRYWNDRWFLSLPPPPWDVGSLLTPIAAQPYDALEAAWHLVQRPEGTVSFKHLWSGRYLCYDPKDHALSSCFGHMCDSYSTDFDIWPKLIGVPFEGKNATEKVPRPEATPEKPDYGTPPYNPDTKPFMKRDANTSAAAALGFHQHKFF